MTDNIIETVEITKDFGKLHVLKGINQHVARGEVVSIIGPSGSGKSTFLRCLNLLEKPTSGKILFEGEEITGKRVNIDQHRQKMGMVFQHFNIFPNLTVDQNITMAPVLLKKKTKAEAADMAKELLTRVVCWIRSASIPPACPADRSSAWPSSGRGHGAGCDAL